MFNVFCSTELQADLVELLKPYQETCGNLSKLLESPVGQTAFSLLEVITLAVEHKKICLWI